MAAVEGSEDHAADAFGEYANVEVQEEAYTSSALLQVGEGLRRVKRP